MATWFAGGRGCRMAIEQQVDASGRSMSGAPSNAIAAGVAAAMPDLQEAGGLPTPFRFYDNRQKYLAFVNTCNEKAAIARRAAQELGLLHPVPPALQFFDAGMGDATVLARLMRNTHRTYPTVPLLVVAKEISLEDVRLGLEKMPDRFTEHPATVLVITNLNYAEAPRLMPRDVQSAAALNCRKCGLRGVQRTSMPSRSRRWGQLSPTDGRPGPARNRATRSMCVLPCS
jgi:hypothetical protein